MDGVRGIETNPVGKGLSNGAHAISRLRTENTVQQRIRESQEDVAAGNHPCARIRKAMESHNAAELQKETGSYYRTGNTVYKTSEGVGSIINKKV